MKLFKLTFGVLMMSAMLFTSIRMWGVNQSYRPFESAFFQNSQAKDLLEIVIPWEQGFLLEKNPQWILWADTYLGDGENLLVKPWADRNLAKKDLEKSPTPARPLLKDLLLKYPQSRFVVNCNENTVDIHHQLMQVIEQAKARDRVLLQSDYNTILDSAKELSPMMVYGSTPADLTRLKAFNSLFLLPTAPFKSDVLFANLTYHQRNTIDRDISQELRHRFKKVFLGPLKSKDELQKALDIGVDGVFLEDPFLAPRP